MQQFPARNLRRLLALGLALLALSACAPNVPSSDPNTENGNVDTQNPPTSDTPIDPADTTAAPAAPDTTSALPVESTESSSDETTAIPPAVSGSFSSDTGSNLEIHLNWAVIAQTDTAVTVRAEAYLTHYSIWVSARSGGILKIGNSSQNFSTEAITYEGNSKQVFVLTTSTVDIPLDQNGTAAVDISVFWPFLGTYSDVKIDHLRCGGTISIGRSTPVAEETTVFPTTTADTTASLEPQTTPITEQGSPILYKSTVYVDRDAQHFGAVTLIRSTAERDRLLEAHPADCTNAACTALTDALSACDEAYFAQNALLLIPQGNLYPTASPVEIFDIRTDDSTIYIHIRDIAASRSTEPLLSTRFYVQAAEIPADALTDRTISIVQHGVYYTDSGKYERDYLLEEGTSFSLTVRTYQPSAISPS